MNVLCGTVNASGEVQVLNLRFWSPDLVRSRGWEVEIHFDNDGTTYADAWTKGRQQRLCTVMLIDNRAGMSIDERRAADDAERSKLDEMRRENAALFRQQASDWAALTGEVANSPRKRRNLVKVLLVLAAAELGRAGIKQAHRGARRGFSALFGK